MKILIINDFLLIGGAEIYTESLANLLKDHGNDVYIISFDKDFESKIENFRFEKNRIINFKVKSKLSKLLFKKNLYNKLTSKIKEINPDKIIVNNLFSSPITQYKALEGYDAYQVVHDYSFICPNLMVSKKDGTICKGYKYEKCSKYCKHHNSKLQLLLKLHLVRKLENIRKQYIKKFIVPSSKLANYLVEYGYKSICMKNPIDTKELALPNKNLSNAVRTYTYVGLINDGKGIFRFLKVYDKFSKNHNVKLRIIGKTMANSDKAKLNCFLNNNSSIEFLGYKNHSDIEDEMKKSDFAIVPSFYMENYPTTVLEGVLAGNVVIASDRSGATEILENNRGLLFNILDENNIYSVLEKSYNLTDTDYNQIRNKAFEYIVDNNSYEVYYEEFMKTIND